MKTKYRYILLLLPTFAIFYVLFKQVGVKNIMNELYRANLTLLLFAFVLSLISVLLTGQKFKLMIEMVGYKIDFIKCQKIIIATCAVNVIIPSKGGDFFKSWSVRDVLPLSKGFGIVLWERCIDIILLCLMALFGGLLISNKEVILLSTCTLILFLFGSVVILKFSEYDWKGRFTRHVKGISEVFRYFFIKKKHGIAVLLVGLLIWVVSAIQVLVLYWAFGQNVPVLFSFAVVPIAIFVGLIPITIAGMGTRDAAFIFLFSAYASDSSSIAVAMFFSLFRYWLLALIGLPFLRHLYGNELPDSAAFNVK